MKSHLHANASVSKFGGVRDDYIEIHEFLDSTKAHHADMRHRALLHNSWGIYLAERIFGRTFINASGKEVSVRDVCENHILEDLGRIPSVSDYLNNMVLQTWMCGQRVRKRKIKLKMEKDPTAAKPIQEPNKQEPEKQEPQLCPTPEEMERIHAEIEAADAKKRKPLRPKDTQIYYDNAFGGRRDKYID